MNKRPVTVELTITLPFCIMIDTLSNIHNMNVLHIALRSADNKCFIFNTFSFIARMYLPTRTILLSEYTNIGYIHDKIDQNVCYLIIFANACMHPRLQVS